jgi:eukaryotic-like serine/threonine-protein kinase
MTLKEYAASQITYFNKTLTDFNLIESNTNITLGGGNNSAYGLLYANKVDGTNYKTMEIGTIIGDRIYYIEYIAEEKQYSNYLPTIQMMINSLQIR